ncbi:hypothetical protein AXK12_01770 [Cephaloticoccus capnophilus]|uniref:Ribonuclease R n=1 Tax=Cephaloticoccus capnophilus TaxID=1548208 RepID=A0A139SS60_9BACT|nr:RNB domain-containing ribonuclease [Cephaloticoccus capnophilus]KXU37429.1 hypothetical protein AXK12_01770 [Cephaloticoccus capnophilus]
MKLNERLIALLREAKSRPLSASEIASQLGLPKRERKALSTAIQRLLNAGKLHRSRAGLLSLPASKAARKTESAQHSQPTSTHDELSGEIRFRSGGSAYVVIDSANGAAAGLPASAPAQTIQIAATAAGTALHGDRVALRLIGNTPRRGPQARYAARSKKHRRDSPSERDDELRGEVLRVLSRSRDTLVGELRKNGKHWFVTPDDPRFAREVLVEAPNRIARASRTASFAQNSLTPAPTEGDKVVVRLDAWDTRNAPLTGTLVARLGRTHEPRAELLGVLETYKLSPAFPHEVEAEAAALPAKVRPAELIGRLDYREIPTLTIDPDDAKDFDDALSIEPLPKGRTRVGIHIADVATYVRPDTALDREAQKRGNSTYLVGTVIPMLPEKLSNGLCSLVEGEDRLCKAVFLTFDAQGAILEKDFAATVIRSRKRLTYKQAYALLFTDDLQKVRSLPLPPKHQTGSTGRALSTLPQRELAALQIWVRRLWKIASALRRERMAHGSLDLDMPETKIYVDEQGYADRLERVDNDESHQLIEEFMLAANEAVAQLTRSARLPSLYRVHDDPEPDRLNELRSELATHGLSVGNLAVRAELTRLLAQLATHPQGHLLRSQLLRSLKKACYREKPDGHYGLHKRDYTHFTSPIRRYADLVVHRVLASHLAQKNKHPAGRGEKITGKTLSISTASAGARGGQHIAAHRYTAAVVAALGEHLSQTELNAQAAERESVKIKTLEFFERELAKPVPTHFAAIVTEVRSTGFFIELTESLTFGFLPLANFGKKRKLAARIRAGDPLEVVVHKVDRFRRTIDFRAAP